MKTIHRLAAVAVLGLAASALEAAPSEPDGHVFFESRIRPVLLKHCFECHSADKSKGGLRLDYLGSFAKGADSEGLTR